MADLENLENTTREINNSFNEFLSLFNSLVAEKKEAIKKEKELKEEEKKLREAEIAARKEADKKLREQVEKEIGIRASDNKSLKGDVEEAAQLRKRKKEIEEEILQHTRENFSKLNKEQRQAVVNAHIKRQQEYKEAQKSSQLFETMLTPGKKAGELGEQFGTMSGLLQQSKNGLIDFWGGGLKAQLGMEFAASAANIAGAAFKGAATAVLNMSKAVLSGERGMSVGAKGISDFTRSITGAVNGFSNLAIGISGVLFLLAPFTGGLTAAAGVAFLGLGLAGKAAATTAETLAEMNEKAAELNDKLFAGFNELGKASMTGAQGMTGVINNLHKMGLTVAEFEKFRTVIANNSKEMKMFGTTAEEGVNKFAEVSGNLLQSEMGKTLQLMGIGAEEQYEHTAKYLALQARLGNAQEKNTQKLAASTNEYIKELDKIAEITGATRKEQEEARNAVMAIEELRAAIESEDDPAKRAQLERGLEQAEFLIAQGLRRQGTGFAQLIAAGGAPTGSREAQEAFLTMPKTLEAVLKGEGTKFSRAMMSAGEVGAAAKQYGRVARYGAGATEGVFSEYAAAGDLRAKLAGYNEAREKAMKEQGTAFDQKKFEQMFLQNRVAVDDTTKKNIELVNTQRDSAITLDKAVKKYSDAVNINVWASNKMADVVEKMGQMAGVKGGPVYSSGAEGGDAMGASVPSQGGGGGYRTIAERVQRLNFGGQMAERTGGGEPTSALVDIAEKIVGSYPGAVFTAMDDLHHRRDPKLRGSKHTKGKALDVKLFPPPQNREEADIIKKAIMEMGASKVLDEYFADKSQYTTGDHFHVEVARGGGFFSGPNSGFPVMMHNRESVWPEPKLEALMNSVKKQSIEEYKQNMLSTTGSDNAGGKDVAIAFNELKDTLSVKLDAVIDKLSNGNDIQQNILNYSM